MCMLQYILNVNMYVNMCENKCYAYESTYVQTVSKTTILADPRGDQSRKHKILVLSLCKDKSTSKLHMLLYKHVT